MGDGLIMALAVHRFPHEPKAEPSVISDWCLSPWKRALDIVLSGIALILFAAPALLIAIAVRLTSSGPALFRQQRAGLHGREFCLLKFRTMYVNCIGPGITRSGDARVTPLGRWLRRWKLDELPQLINVLRGEMSLVGPRPDLLRFFAAASERERDLLRIRPGITSEATLQYRDEEELLARVGPGPLETYYVAHILPAKAATDLEYAARASWHSDLRLLLRTVLALVH